MAQDELEENAVKEEGTEESVGTGTLEVIEGAEEILPEEQPKWADVDHSKLYIWVADSGNDRIQKFDGNGKFLFQFGKSANTGECIQPCRREYLVTDIEEKHSFTVGSNYILSPKDLCTIPFIEKLIESGISANKVSMNSSSSLE